MSPTAVPPLRALLLVLSFAFVAACGSGTKTPAGASRELVFNVPQEGSSISEATTLSVAGEGIARVRFAVDGTTAFEDASEPFEWVLLPENLAAGAHLLAVEVETEGGLESVQVRFTRAIPEFTLTVHGGSGDGEYRADTVIAVEAEAASAGQVFDHWTGDVAYLASATSAATSVTMPAQDIAITATYAAEPVPGDSNGSWTRKVLSFTNTTYSGNPFELEIDATFTHATSGTVIKLPGYYAGNDTWKVAFMPTEKGTWNWVTASPDADLDGQTGSVEHTLDGPLLFLRGDADHLKKWRLSGGPYVIPMALRCEFFCEPATTAQFTAVATSSRRTRS